MTSKVNGMQGHSISEEDVSGEIVNAVIIYYNCGFATKAYQLLKRATSGTNEPTQWRVKPWRVDVLKLSPANEEAMAEMSGAHLIVLAVFEAQSLLPWLIDWLEWWATRRQIQEAALAVWEGANADARMARATPELSRFVGRHGLSLILNDAMGDDESSMFGRDPRPREVDLFPRLQNYQRWGINE